ncbi:MAG: DUF2252 family protein, partial [Actinomycetes bacterium]
MASVLRTALPTNKERSAAGQALREQVKRGELGRWRPAEDRPDPLDLIEEAHEGRLQRLVPVRVGRMMASPYAFLRGSAALMAEDFAHLPRTGVEPVICGDAHLGNFGFYASPERDLVFDLNDFDETLPGPWEWDLKRLAASIAVAARSRGFSAGQSRAAVRAAVRRYREAIRGFAGMTSLQVWYARLDEAEIEAQFANGLSKAALARLDRNVEKARRKDHLRAFARLVQEVDGEPRFISDPPLLVPVHELVPDGEAAELHARMRELIDGYRATLP